MTYTNYKAVHCNPTINYGSQCISGYYYKLSLCDHSSQWRPPSYISGEGKVYRAGNGHWTWWQQLPIYSIASKWTQLQQIVERLWTCCDQCHMPTD